MSALGSIHESLSVETYTAAEEHHRNIALRLLAALDAVLATHAACYGGRGCETTRAVNEALEVGK